MIRTPPEGYFNKLLGLEILFPAAYAVFALAWTFIRS